MTDTATTAELTVEGATALIDTYFAMWNEEDVARRAELIEQAWTADARYRDPLLEADGYDGLSTMVDTVHQHYPGQRFTRLSGVDLHHDQARVAWQLAGDEGDPTVVGIDFVELAEDGRIRRITGFFGDLPAA